MRISLRQLQIFCAVARTGSTSAAAEQIALSQSATSAALNELEVMLATKLFDRVGRRLLLNDSGKLLLSQARQVLDGVERIEEYFRGETGTFKGTLTVGASSTIGNYVLPRYLAEFRNQFPEIRINVAISNSAAVAAMVANFEVDIGLIEGPCHQQDLDVTPWLSDELVVFCAAGHPLGMGKQASAEALQQADWLLREQGSGTREEVEHALLPHLHSLNARMELGSSEAIKRSVAAGLGISCLSRWVVADLLACGQVQELDSVLPPLSRRFYMLRHRDKFASPAFDRFWRHCQG
ncbi:LysR family transcriptional regulator [Pseudomonas benzenivorans]|uniref:LysR family transcriptional regulator n=1 Tax=Pseudomonas benzenivorans TaxID=556533 RepID=A0ABY5H7G5_9PSED|nr:LysR family transcriptional regulator [Pseudomonas benzenivorans]UTW07354.1 LysR family transcriptional regulator [Pseudomonas benzenivorans]